MAPPDSCPVSDSDLDPHSVPDSAPDSDSVLFGITLASLLKIPGSSHFMTRKIDTYKLQALGA